MPTTPDVRAAVLAAMQAKKMTQREVADAADIPQPSLARWLSGARDVNVGTAERVMGSLGLRIAGPGQRRSK